LPSAALMPFIVERMDGSKAMVAMM
jgi:hypothetical protein